MLARLPASVRAVAITGGEPLLRPKRLNVILEKILKSGRYSSVVTNGLWARDPKIVAQVLKNAHHSGLRGIAVSIDDYHRPELPIQSLKYIIQSVVELGMAVRLKGVGRGAARKIRYYSKALGIPLGRADRILHDLDRVGHGEKIDNDIPSQPRTSCLALLDPFVMPDGKMVACCTTQSMEFQNRLLQRGSLLERPIDKILQETSSDYRIAAIIVLGPLGIARRMGWSVDRRLSRCDLCASLFRTPDSVRQFTKRISDDREFRKEIVGRIMMVESRDMPRLMPEFEKGPSIGGVRSCKD